MKLRPFTKEDYYGYADAEKSPNGDPPLISYESTYNGRQVCVIVDGSGIGIDATDGTNQEFYNLHIPYSVAKWICENALCNTIPQSLIDIMEKIL